MIGFMIHTLDIVNVDEIWVLICCRRKADDAFSKNSLPPDIAVLSIELG